MQDEINQSTAIDSTVKAVRLLWNESNITRDHVPHDGSGVGLSASVLSNEILIYVLEVFMAASAIGVIVSDSLGEEINNDAGPVVARGIERDTKPMELEDSPGGKGTRPTCDQGRIDSALESRVCYMLLSQNRVELCGKAITLAAAWG